MNPTPALKTFGVVVGGVGGSALLGALMSLLMSPTFMWGVDGGKVGALTFGLAICYLWTFLTMKSENVATGIPSLDANNRKDALAQSVADAEKKAS